jgi:hypothetical protein
LGKTLARARFFLLKNGCTGEALIPFGYMLITSGNNRSAENSGTHSPIVILTFFLVNSKNYFVVFKQQNYPQVIHRISTAFHVERLRQC